MSPRALVVDDDRTMVKTLADVLKHKGWDVTTAHSGEDAVQIAWKESFDVVLMDVKMPGMDGVEAFKAMKAAKPSVRVILMTAYAAQDRLEEAQQHGVLRVLSKPVDIASLMHLLASSVRGERPVLLIDHDIAFLKTLSDVLTLRGFRTVVADNLAQASRLLVEQRPAAVLLHVHVWAMSAREAVAAVRTLSPSVSLILYSGRASAEVEIENALPDDWIHAYLRKPFAVDDLTGVLNGVIDG
jgi:two-component system, NtrC family, response regulator HydG